MDHTKSHKNPPLPPFPSFPQASPDRLPSPRGRARASACLPAPHAGHGADSLCPRSNHQGILLHEHSRPMRSKTQTSNFEAYSWGFDNTAPGIGQGTPDVSLKPFKSRFPGLYDQPPPAIAFNENLNYQPQQSESTGRRCGPSRFTSSLGSRLGFPSMDVQTCNVSPSTIHWALGASMR